MFQKIFFIASLLFLQPYVLKADDIVRFAVIGDYGLAGEPEARVADLVASWKPDFIVTTGDNNYPNGKAATIDANIGQYYSSYIFPYRGTYGKGATVNRFFPTLGNHDWDSNERARPYLNYFTLPGKERYYDIIKEPVHFFFIDSDPREPAGIKANSIQAKWLERGLQASTQSWNIVVMHHPPYSSGDRGSHTALQWPYQKWGADVVLTGHDHMYERLIIHGVVYFVNGLGGYPARYGEKKIEEGSLIRYSDDWGAMKVAAHQQSISFEFITVSGKSIDRFTLQSRK